MTAEAANLPLQVRPGNATLPPMSFIVGLLVRALPMGVILCFAAGTLAGLASFPVGWEATAYEQLAAEAVPARARLEAKELTEWFAGNGDWYASGRFAVSAHGYEGAAEGNLNPPEFHKNRARRVKTQRAEVEPFLANWQVGAVYDAFFYPDRRDKLFFQLPDAASWRGLETWLRRIAGGLLLLGAALYIVMARRRDAFPIPSALSAPSAPEAPRDKKPKGGKRQRR